MELTELMEGMYVRTKKGSIGKILDIDLIEGNSIELGNIAGIYFDNVIDDISNELYWGVLPQVFEDSKLSNNIIDLIEVGDILEINNEKYEVIYDKSYDKLGILIPNREELSIRHSALEYVFKKYKVSIITKEQFESMSYKL